MVDLNARLGIDEVLDVIGKYDAVGRNVSGERQVEMRSEMEIVIGNTHFRKNGLNKFTLKKNSSKLRHTDCLKECLD